jgi:hypothetical protein
MGCMWLVQRMQRRSHAHTLGLLVRGAEVQQHWFVLPFCARHQLVLLDCLDAQGWARLDTTPTAVVRRLLSGAPKLAGDTLPLASNLLASSAARMCVAVCMRARRHSTYTLPTISRVPAQSVDFFNHVALWDSSKRAQWHLRMPPSWAKHGTAADDTDMHKQRAHNSSVPCKRTMQRQQQQQGGTHSNSNSNTALSHTQRPALTRLHGVNGSPAMHVYSQTHTHTHTHTHNDQDQHSHLTMPRLQAS